jgi:hypothetical protein
MWTDHDEKDSLLVLIGKARLDHDAVSLDQLPPAEATHSTEYVAFLQSAGSVESGARGVWLDIIVRGHCCDHHIRSG